METSFPVKGAIAYGQIEFEPYVISGENARFYNSSLFGETLVKSYEEAERQDWAGCLIDNTVFSAKANDREIISEGLINSLINQGIIAYYPVPMKDGTKEYKHCLRIIGPLNNAAFRNFAVRIERLFKQHMNGKPLPASVSQKMMNTIDFARYFRSDINREDE